MNHRYRLATYRECKAHREWNTTCPSCGRRGKFSPYIDTVTMRPVDDRQCGRCNRLSNCGYHLPPREMPRTEDFISRGARGERENPGPVNSISHAKGAENAKFASFHSRIVPPQHSAISPTSCEPSATQPSRSLRSSRETKKHQREVEEFYAKMRRACEQSQPWGSHLVTWLRTKFPREQVAAALKRYRVGGTPDGTTLWWQIDEQGRVHTGKAMQYNPLTGHRVKESPPLIPPEGEGRDRDAGTPPPWGRSGGGPSPVNWAHRMRLYGEPSDLVVPQCLFGLSLLNTEHTASTTDYTDCSDSLQDGNSIPQDVNPCNPRHPRHPWSNNPWSENSLREIGVVESEKTALILSLVCPDKLWLATGGKANFKESMLWPLVGCGSENCKDCLSTRFIRETCIFARLTLILVTSSQKIHCNGVTSSHSSRNLKVPSSQPTLTRVGGIKNKIYFVLRSACCIFSVCAAATEIRLRLGKLQVNLHFRSPYTNFAPL